ncbi:MAG: hypothetical protein J6C55_03885 [Oscillospiraceae bacterium]|nr:hypothetical protein [Oscillospiraceae bacterium]
MIDFKIDKRIYILFGLSIMFFLIFALQLFKIQIIDNNKYVFLANSSSSKIQVIKASRGEITDRNSKIIVSNKNGFNIALNKALIDKNSENKLILDIKNLLYKYNINQTDELPFVFKNNKIYFDKNKKREVKLLKSYFECNEKVSPKELLEKIIKKYKLQKYTVFEALTIAGVKYSMEICGYSYSNPYVIARNIPIESLIKFKESSYDFQGVEIIETPSREYILSDLAPHLIGNVGPIFAEEYEVLKEQDYKINDIIGKNGIEKYCEKYLRGSDGEKIVNLDNQGNVSKLYIKNEPIPGNTVVLTIDSDLQYVAQKSLEKQIINLNNTAPAGKGKEADSGAVVVLNIKTGEVLAMATFPSYNINEYNKNFSELINNEKKPLFNRALLGAYAPGSCYKPAVAVAALEENVASATSCVRCGHVYNFFSGYKPRCLGHHGNINVMDALKLSCNIYFYDVGRILGIDRINFYSQQLGLGCETGIELPENIGQLASPELRKKNGGSWYPGDVLQAAVGQSDNLMSPLQLANYTATIANRGKRMKVSIIKQIKSYDNKTVIYEHNPKVVCNVKATPQVFETVIEGMTRASRIGTARRYFGNYPITVPSKTGTPETANLCNSTFICFAPDKDSEIAIAVVIEKGWHGYTGAPVAKDIIDAYFKK